MNLKNCLDQILSFLVHLKRPIKDLLNTGLTEKDISIELRKLAFDMPKEFYDLYAWRNGTEIRPGTTLDDLNFFPGFYFLSLEDAFRQYQVMKNDSRWNRCWFPIFANGGGDFYAIDHSQIMDDNIPVIGFILGESEHPIEYQSIASMMATLLDCFKSNVFFVASDGYLEMDDIGHAAIAKEHNPDVEFWKDL
jgi:hypothetical protein